MKLVIQAVIKEKVNNIVNYIAVNFVAIFAILLLLRVYWKNYLRYNCSRALKEFYNLRVELRDHINQAIIDERSDEETSPLLEILHNVNSTIQYFYFKGLEVDSNKSLRNIYSTYVFANANFNSLPQYDSTKNTFTVKYLAIYGRSILLLINSVPIFNLQFVTQTIYKFNLFLSEKLQAELLLPKSVRKSVQLKRDNEFFVSHNHFYGF